MSDLHPPVASLHWSKELLKAGWPQSWTGVFSAISVERVEQILPTDPFGGCYFKWFETPGGDPAVHSVWCNYAMIAEAPTAEEILRRLPYKLVRENGEHFWLNISGGKDGKWQIKYTTGGVTHFVFCTYDSSNLKTGVANFLDYSLADTVAAMWCYLAKEKLLPAT